MGDIIHLHSEDYYKRRGRQFYLSGIQSVTASNNFEKARFYFTEALRFHPDNNEYRFYIGVTYFMNNQAKESLPYLKSAYQREPVHADYTHIYGMALYQLKRYEEAASVFETNRENNPNHLNSLFYLGKIKALEPATQNQALACFDHILGMDSDHYDSLFEKGCIHLNQHHYNEAHDLFQQTISIQPTYAVAYYYLSKTLLKQGRHDEAIRILSALLEHCPNEKELVETNINVINTLKDL
ncbi:tetratricopeptide repeat protein (plasmid) [Pontibacillus sp. ALD_SL1]|uniref:tetratricopeptide repeat protein n=1 Tax=Pontibacillus sp. ALD_SL1 TaxID=2777185 RepID=UPI001A96430B|nr:tetratricopeptide repeat protein [Pontibacillus sp. ALD_SL1]QST03081.1 tetratricopeptide repeat protein [Pontibacillus sp. ALD_SL1]